MAFKRGFESSFKTVGEGARQIFRLTCRLYILNAVSSLRTSLVERHAQTR